MGVKKSFPISFFLQTVFIFLSQNKKPKKEKFSMVILARGFPAEANRWPRITQPVLKRPRHVHCHLCCPDGHRQHAVITAHQHGRYGGCDQNQWETAGTCSPHGPLCSTGTCIAVPVSAPGEISYLWSHHLSFLRPPLEIPLRADKGVWQVFSLSIF